MRFGPIYSTGIAMGLGPRQVDDLSLWEFGQIVDGWMTANGIEPRTKPLSDDEHDALVAKYP